MNKKILEVKNISTAFAARGKQIQAVRGVDIDVYQGEILGIVGESGSGKSVSMKTVMGLLPENASVRSEGIIFEGRDLASMSAEERRRIRGKEMTMIFQDPMTALNPLMKIGEHLTEVILRHDRCSKSEARERAVEVLRSVGISSPEERMNQYPHEFSGGMRQRVLIGMALSCNPKLLIADEPTTALDVTIQAQILDLLRDMQKKKNTSIVLITHDMGVVATICTRIMIMYGGLIMEEGLTEEIFYNARHPYTIALLEAIPSLNMPEGERLKSIDGMPPSLVNPPVGCPFEPRCRYSTDRCKAEMPQYRSYTDTHRAMCFYEVRK